MPEKKMIEITYEDVAELVKSKGRMDATISYLKMQNNSFVGIGEVIAMLTGEVPCGAE